MRVSLIATSLALLVFGVSVGWLLDRAAVWETSGLAELSSEDGTDAEDPEPAADPAPGASDEPATVDDAEETTDAAEESPDVDDAEETTDAAEESPDVDDREEADEDEEQAEDVASTRVPDLVGRTEEAARAVLSAARLDIEIVEDLDAAAEPGRVVDQSEPATTPAEPGSSITVTVATDD